MSFRFSNSTFESNTLHKFSIIFKSGLCAGHSNNLIFKSSKNLLVSFGSLSCCKIYSSSRPIFRTASSKFSHIISMHSLFLQFVPNYQLHSTRNTSITLMTLLQIWQLAFCMFHIFFFNCCNSDLLSSLHVTFFSRMILTYSHIF